MMLKLYDAIQQLITKPNPQMVAMEARIMKNIEDMVKAHLST
jgi:Holliday junction resolvasome RuvABC endonuclease subunit